jgi:hypothetical protein
MGIVFAWVSLRDCHFGFTRASMYCGDCEEKMHIMVEDQTEYIEYAHLIHARK